MRYLDNEKLINVCPDEESISSLAEGKLSKNEREALLRHMAVCKTCSAEFYFLRKTQSLQTTVRVNPASNRNIFRLIAIAAMLALVIGFAGHNTLNRFMENNTATMEQKSDIPAMAPAPLHEIAQDIAPNVSYKSAPRAVMPMAAPDMVEYAAGAGAIQETPPVYEVVYKGHDGDKAEIIRLVMLITGTDEENAGIIAESSSIVIKECSSMEEAQRIKEELETAGGKVTIYNSQFTMHNEEKR